MDRGTTLEALPEAYLGMDWISTGNDSADYRGGNPIATFDVNEDTTVFIAVDTRVDPASCLLDWTETGDDLINSGDGAGTPYAILSRAFTAGSTIEMCQYEVDAGMYVIMGGSPPEPEEPADPTNQGPTSVPPGMPAAGVAGLALLIIAGASGGVLAMRRKQS